MLNVDLFLQGAVALVGAAVVYWDVRYGRIPNWLTVGGVALGVAIRAFAGWGGLGSGLAAGAIAFAVSVPFFVAGGLGGGDVKLLAAMGTLVGLERLPDALVYTAFAGGAIAVVAITLYGSWTRVYLNLKGIIVAFLRKAVPGVDPEGPAPVSLDSSDALTIPYGVAIAVGSLLSWYLA